MIFKNIINLPEDKPWQEELCAPEEGTNEQNDVKNNSQGQTNDEYNCEGIYSTIPVDYRYSQK